jgi:DNA-directed RNA polymerase specialized sigma24 family protein
MSERIARDYCAGSIDFDEFYCATRERWNRVFFREQRRSHDGVRPSAVFDLDDFAQVGLLAVARKSRSFDPAKSDSAWFYLTRIATRSAKRAATKARMGVTRAEVGVQQHENFARLASGERDHDDSARSMPSLIDFSRHVRRESDVFSALCAHRNLRAVALAANANTRSVRVARARMIAHLLDVR